MEIVQKDAECTGIRFGIFDNSNNEVGHAFLYIMYNDLHDQPFGLMEDVFIEESARGRGYGTSLVRKVIDASKNNGCYKLIATSRHSRPKVHRMYLSLGFSDQGSAFRIDFS